MQTSFKLTLIAASYLLFSNAYIQAQTLERQIPGPEHKKLAMFVGEWKYQGTNQATPLGPSGKVAGKMTCRMVLNGLFLETRWEDRGFAGSQLDQGIIIQWYDPSTKSYPAHSYGDAGNFNAGVGTVSGNTWTMTGTTTDSKGKVTKNKDTYTFSDDGKAITQVSQISLDDGKTWIPNFELTMKKVGK